MTQPELSCGLVQLAPSSVKHSTGFDTGAGAEERASERVGLYGKASYSWADTAASFKVDGATLRASGIDVNPVVYRQGTIFRF